MYQMVPTIYYFFWLRYHPSKIYSQKKSWQETKYRPPFPPTTKPRPLNPLDRGPTSLVLAKYRLVMLRPFCAYSTVFCVCLPCHFCHNRLVLFRSAACFVLFLHVFPATFVIFLWFGFSFLHMIPVANTSYRSLFLFIVLFHISFLTYFFIQKDLGLCGPDNVDWIKRVLSPICLYLRKPFCQRIVFCGRFVFCCKSLSLALLSLDLSCSLVFLVGLRVLLFIGLSFIWAFASCNLLGFLPYGPLGMNLQKWALTFNPLSIWIAPAI